MDTNLSLGQFLRHEREKRGMTIEQVASATKIGVKTLHALEADHFADLPAKPFIRGFVTSYARFIGIDPREVLTRYGDYIDKKSFDRPNRDAGHSGYAFEKREGEQSRFILGVVMAGFLIIGLAVLIFLKPSLKHHRGSHAEKLRAVHGASGTPAPKALDALLPSVLPTLAPTSLPTGAAGETSGEASAERSSEVKTVAATPSPAALARASETIPALVAAPSVLPAAASVAAAPTPEAKPVPSATPSGAPDPLNSGVNLKASEIKHRLVLKAVDSVWIRYRSDDRPVMQFVLKRDKTLVVRAQSTIIFQTANPNLIHLSYNNQGYVNLAQAKRLVVRQNDSTLFFPAELAEKIEEPFPGEKSLATKPRPLSALRSPTPKATQ